MAAKSGISERLRVFGIAATLGMSACDYVRPDELFVPEADAIVVGAVLNADWANVYLIASHPHRHASEPAPEVTAILTGPSGDAAFDEEVDLSRCGVLIDELWHGPAICLKAKLPRPVQTGDVYSLRGETRLGGFSGVTRVPEPVAILDPAGEVMLDAEAGYGGSTIARLDLHFESPQGVGMVIASVANAVQVVADSTGEMSTQPIRVAYVIPREFHSEQSRAAFAVWADDRGHPWLPPEVRFDVYLAGLDEPMSRFAQFRDDNLVVPPWPDFGLDGDEGIYGYFGSASRSRPISVVVRVP